MRRWWASSLQKAHSCDRHHIANPMAELVSYLSDRTAYAGFDVPPTQPRLTRGIFSAARLPASRTAAEPIANPSQSLPPVRVGRRECTNQDGTNATASGTISRFRDLFCLRNVERY